MKKVFVIGMNKTGTTSLAKTLRNFGYKLPRQVLTESKTLDYINGNVESLFQVIDSYEAFQDNPFSISGIHIPLFEKYPKSKFILTIRSSPEIWYNSLVNSHTKLFSSDKRRPPSSKDLYNCNYMGQGWMYYTMKFKYGTSDKNIYEKKSLLKTYEKHNLNVISFFNKIPNKLLVLDISKNNSYIELCNFLGLKCNENEKFPHLNKT